MNIHLELELSRLRREAFEREAEDARRAKDAQRVEHIQRAARQTPR